jgi:hypothetical protein
VSDGLIIVCCICVISIRSEAAIVPTDHGTRRRWLLDAEERCRVSLGDRFPCRTCRHCREISFTMSVIVLHSLKGHECNVMRAFRICHICTVAASACDPIVIGLP